MTYQISFQYPTCQTCQAKIHCEQCGEEFKARLLRSGEIDSADINMVTKTISVDSPMDLGDLEELLEDLGLLVD